jgi:hypothetical protein
MVGFSGAGKGPPGDIACWVSEVNVPGSLAGVILMWSIFPCPFIFGFDSALAILAPFWFGSVDFDAFQAKVSTKRALCTGLFSR